MKKLTVLAFLLVLYSGCHAQDFGLSFSYFIPRNGYFSTPISPFSIRGVGVNLNRFLAIQTGASLYRMSGLSMKDLPITSRRPFLGPNFTLFVPLELVIQLKGQGAELDLKGGGFGFYGVDNKLNYGNIDRAIRAYEGWAVANSELTFSNHPGYGYYGGVEFTVNATSHVGVSLEANYLVGAASFPLSGSYTGGSSSLQTKPVDYADAKVDFTGIEFSIGVFYRASGNNRRRR